MKYQRLSTVATALVAFFCAAHAEIKLPALISDHMMLQQNTSARIWGKAAPGSTVEVHASWAPEMKYSAVASADSTWSVRVSTPAGSATQHSITVSDGSSSVVVDDILVGEVWLCSGQSNMEMTVRGYPGQPTEGALDAILSARPEVPVRMFKVPRTLASTPQDDCAGSWKTNTPDAVADCSAVAYYFATYLNSIIDVPVGIITSAWGGTTVQCWLSPELNASFGASLDALGAGKPRPTNVYTPSAIHYGMLSPVMPFTFKGMLWYQGEANVVDPLSYAPMMAAFVPDLRKKFENPEMPFYYVQIAPYDGYSPKERPGVAKLRLAQSRLMKDVPNTGMVVTMDLGEARHIHFHNKKEVGKRLAYWALAKDYGRNGFGCAGPIFSHMEIADGKARVFFEAGYGTVAPFGEDITGFEIAGHDGVYYPADASLDLRDGAVVVSSAMVPQPVKVRYAYGVCPEGTLRDVMGLPASPFVSDGSYE